VWTVPDLPWTSIGERVPEGEYEVLLSYLPLARLSSTVAFLLAVRRVRRQLAGAKGLIGYSLRATPFRRQYWTLSVWESERALLAFVWAQPHSGLMSSLRGRMGVTRFVRWRIRGTDPMPAWVDALRRAAAPRQAGR
jgi:heme-degrading monooxygenase HmoA